jgi:hypothetical protein
MSSRLGLITLFAIAPSLTAACVRSSPHAVVAPGAITGLIRRAETGAAVTGAIVVLRRPGELAPERRITDASGAYVIRALPPGTYTVTAHLERWIIGERTVEVRPGAVAGLDFTVAPPAAEVPDLNAPGAPELWRYRPDAADPSTGAIEGTVADLQHQRVASAVVSITATGTVNTTQTVTDDDGRFVVADLAPGSYEVSAYYAVVRRGQMEVRRSRVILEGGDVVVVPLWLETTAQ